jgi:subtilisin family serine protease
MNRVGIVLLWAVILATSRSLWGENTSDEILPSAMPVPNVSKPTSPVERKIAPPIQAIRQLSLKADSPAKLSNRLVHVNDVGEVQVYVRANDLSKATLDKMVASGLRIVIANDKLKTVQGWVSLGAIEKLARLPSVARITPPAYPVLRAGSFMTEGDHILGSDVVRLFGVDGFGIKVGALSNGMDNRAVSQATGDLPTSITIDPAYPGAGDAGTALLEIVYDIAPAASLAFSGPRTSLEFLAALNYLVNVAGCNVVFDDMGFYLEPYFELGPVAQAVAGVASNVVYVSACGDDALGHYQAIYRDINPAASGGANDYHAFAPGDPTLRVRINPATEITVFLQWSDPFGASGNDYDLFLYNHNLTTLLASSTAVQSGSEDPIEALTYYNDSPGPIWTNLVINRDSGATRTLELFVRGADRQEYVTSFDSIIGHPAVPEVLSVGAINAGKHRNDTIAPYSSLGPSTLFYPLARQMATPRLAAIDGVSVSGAGGFATPFYGTSAAAAHVAGIAALLCSSDRSLTPTDVRNRLENTATDLGAPGYDIVFGFGRVNAEKAIPALPARYWYLLP